MSFEDLLREHLHAATVTGQPAGVDVVMARGRRRRNRRRAVASVALALAVVVAGVGVARLVRPDDMVGVATEGALPAQPPPTLRWSTEPADGLSMMAQGPVEVLDDIVYAVSTAPGQRTLQASSDTLYRLGDDGRWQVVNDRSAGVELGAVSGADGVLYAIGTVAANEGAGFAGRLSRSEDGGATWDVEDLPAVEPPSPGVPWQATSRIDVASTPDLTMAVVSTEFHVPAEVFGALAPVDDPSSHVVVDAGGASLVRYSPEQLDAHRHASTVVTTEPLAPPVAEELARLTWPDLGLTGVDALLRTDAFVHRGDGWDAVDVEVEGRVSRLDAVGGEVLATAFPATSLANGAGGAVPVTQATSNGVDWRDVTLAEPYNTPVLDLGGAWVQAPLARFPQHEVFASYDRGASWQAISLPEVDVRLSGDLAFGAVDSGPLGLAIIVREMDGDPALGHLDEPHLLLTRDLRSWSLTPLSEILPDPGWGNDRIDVGADRIVFTSDSPPGEATATVVGTPTR